MSMSLAWGVCGGGGGGLRVYDLHNTLNTSSTDDTSKEKCKNLHHHVSDAGILGDHGRDVGIHSDHGRDVGINCAVPFN